MKLTADATLIVVILVGLSILLPTNGFSIQNSVATVVIRETHNSHPSTALMGHSMERANIDLGIPIPRRAALFAPAAAVLPMFLTLPSNAVIGGATQSARVESWPGIESLEPMYELKLSIDAMVSGLQNPKNWPYIQKRLDKFFGGFIVSEKNFYFGVGLQYMNDIQYNKAELPNYVLLDKQARYDALEQTMKNLENLRSVLAIGGSDAATVEDFGKSSQSALSSWFALVPDGDVKAVEDLFFNVKKADVNRDGKLSDNELSLLSPSEQEIWIRRVAKFG